MTSWKWPCRLLFITETFKIMSNMVIEVGENLQPYIHFEFCFSCPKRLFFNFYCTNTNDNKYLDENNNI
jgi:hypothetical protein